MSDRFFSAEPLAADRVTLRDAEAHHLLHVMRAKPGQRVVLFDGSGRECVAEVVRCGRADVEFRVLDRQLVDRELPFELVVGVSLPKGDRQKWLVEKLTEIGVTTLVPLITTRGVAQPTASALERLERSVIEAAKQCGRNRLMGVAKPQAWGSWIIEGSGLVADDSGLPNIRRLIANPDGTPVASIDLATHTHTLLAIGPEGGFTEEEFAAATGTGWQAVDLGARILRVETAAVAFAAVVALSARS